MPQVLIPVSHVEGPSEPERKLRFMELVRRRMREMRYAGRTCEAYEMWIKRYVMFSGRRHPADLDTEDVRAFLADLAAVRRVSASTLNQAAAEMMFLYARVVNRRLDALNGIVPASRPKRLPTVLSPDEIRAILRALREPDRTIASLMYGSGLRITECVSLRVKDIDLERRVITVRCGKGEKDRSVPLAQSSIAKASSASDTGAPGRARRCTCRSHRQAGSLSCISSFICDPFA